MYYLSIYKQKIRPKFCDLSCTKRSHNPLRHKSRKNDCWLKYFRKCQKASRMRSEIYHTTPVTTFIIWSKNMKRVIETLFQRWPYRSMIEIHWRWSHLKNLVRKRWDCEWGEDWVKIWKFLWWRKRRRKLRWMDNVEVEQLVTQRNCWFDCQRRVKRFVEEEEYWIRS